MPPDNPLIDRLIHEPARLTLVAALAVVRDADFVYLLRETGLTKGNLVSHMDKLENGGYVDIEKSFVDKTPRTLYRLTRKGRSALRKYRQTMRAILDELPD
jgi:DNA-binding MarR family transcriptional regulator